MCFFLNIQWEQRLPFEKLGAMRVFVGQFQRILNESSQIHLFYKNKMVFVGVLDIQSQ